MPAEHSQLFSKVFAMLREDGVSKADVARALDLKTSDVEELVFGLTLLPVVGGDHSPKSRKAQIIEFGIVDRRLTKETL